MKLSLQVAGWMYFALILLFKDTPYLLKRGTPPILHIRINLLIILSITVNRDGITDDATKLHYGKGRIQFGA